MPLRSRAAEIAKPPSSIAVKPLSAPDSLPMGVRAPPTITDPGMDGLPCPVVLFSSFLLLGHVEVGDRALEGLGGHGHGLRQSWVRVDGEPDVGGVRAGLD